MDENVYTKGVNLGGSSREQRCTIVWKVQLGQRIQECRKNMDIAQKELGNAVGKDEHYISVIERGVDYPGVEKLISILKVLKVPVVTESITGT